MATRTNPRGPQSADEPKEGAPEPQGEQAPQQDPQDYVAKLFAAAGRLAKERQEVYDKQAKVRTALRSMRDAGALTPEQGQRVSELYPDTKRGKKKETGNGEAS